MPPTTETARQAGLIAALATLLGCAGTAPDPPAASSETNAARAMREEFDPRSIHEDLLLIQPNFPRPRAATSTPIAPTAGASEPSLPTDLTAMDEPVPAPDLPLAETETDPPAVLPDPAPTSQPSYRVETVTEHVYRVQIMAVSNETVARERAESLRQQFDSPVFVKAQGPLFVVRIGSCATRSEAGALKDKVAAMHSDYREAYVLGVDETRELRIPEVADPIPAAPPRPDPEPELAPAFGWRVLISQFLTNQDAVKERRKIMRQYKREDVDVSFAAPWYKVEVGHFAIDEEAKAQELAEFFKSKGYEALKVRSEVLLPKMGR